VDSFDKYSAGQVLLLMKVWGHARTGDADTVMLQSECSKTQPAALYNMALTKTLPVIIAGDVATMDTMIRIG
jgi:hypothetical protein